MKTQRSWTEKLETCNGLPKIENIPVRMQKRSGKGTMVIPSPGDVNSVMKKVARGQVITINRIRQKLAKKYHADIACPMTTGIFSWIAAHAAEEQKQHGKKILTPYWRTLKEGGVVNEKYPGGVHGQAKLLRSEGHRIVEKRGRWIVADWQQSLAR